MTKSRIKKRFLQVALGLSLAMTGMQNSSAVSDDFSAISVRQLLTQCLKQNENFNLSPSSCDLYISGFIAATRQFDVSDQFCSTDEEVLALPAVRDEFVQWALNHSEEYDSSAASVLVGVMTALYPCRNNGNSAE